MCDDAVIDERAAFADSVWANCLISLYASDAAQFAGDVVIQVDGSLYIDDVVLAVVVEEQPEDDPVTLTTCGGGLLHGDLAMQGAALHAT